MLQRGPSPDEAFHGSDPGSIECTGVGVLQGIRGIVCMITKCVHIELISKLTIDAFIAALHQFIARRRIPVPYPSNHWALKIALV